MPWLDPRARGSDDGRVPDPNVPELIRFAGLLALAVFCALPAPPALFAATLSSLLFMAAGCMSLIAALRADLVLDDRLTRWDVAAALLATGLFFGFFVDPEALRLALEPAT